MWKEAGPPPDLATRLFSERIIYLVRYTHDTCPTPPPRGGDGVRRA